MCQINMPVSRRKCVRDVSDCLLYRGVETVANAQAIKKATRPNDLVPQLVTFSRSLMSANQSQSNQKNLQSTSNM